MTDMVAHLSAVAERLGISRLRHSMMGPVGEKTYTEDHSAGGIIVWEQVSPGTRIGTWNVSSERALHSAAKDAVVAWGACTVTQSMLDKKNFQRG